jgi:hypothetical protein
MIALALMNAGGVGSIVPARLAATIAVVDLLSAREAD